MSMLLFAFSAFLPGPFEPTTNHVLDFSSFQTARRLRTVTDNPNRGYRAGQTSLVDYHLMHLSLAFLPPPPARVPTQCSTTVLRSSVYQGSCVSTLVNHPQQHQATTKSHETQDQGLETTRCPPALRLTQDQVQFCLNNHTDFQSGISMQNRHASVFILFHKTIFQVNLFTSIHTSAPTFGYSPLHHIDSWNGIIEARNGSVLDFYGASCKICESPSIPIGERYYTIRTSSWTSNASLCRFLQAPIKILRSYTLPGVNLVIVDPFAVVFRLECVYLPIADGLLLLLLKEKFEVYLFVKKYSGIGWDDEDHHATATEEVIKTFLEVYLHPSYATCFSVHGSCAVLHLFAATASVPPQLHLHPISVWRVPASHASNLAQAHGTKYTRYFRTPCPYYTKLDQLYDGMVNKATGEHIVHLGNPAKKKRKSKKASDPSTPSTSTATPNPATTAPNSTTTTIATAAAAGNNDANKENEIMEIDGVKDSAGAGGKGNGRFDDELILVHSGQTSTWPMFLIQETGAGCTSLGQNLA
ncbi:hypothetical protein B0H14DRAFT_2601269 [Mycena olivaceomarginata]|nr:hypothetical protein B0H14DRAFT_2601269 [Mycena olivaceomarginata]